jgi:hypothetical protein
MRNCLLLTTLFASLTASGCNQTECGPGTVERDGSCQPSTADFDPSMCGPFTELQGDQCVPVFTPTECDPGSTEASVDPETGVVTCIGTGSSSCDSPIACPTPTGATKLTICGQIYDFETSAKFAEGAGNCDPQNPGTTGPCALQILVFDAIAFGTSPTTAPMLPADSITIDKCGRYRVAGIETGGTGPFIGLGFDDGPQGSTPAAGGLTVTVGVAAPKAEGPVISGFEAFVVKQSTTTLWQNSGGPMLGTFGGTTGGIYAAIFREHKKGIGDQLQPENDPAKITKSDVVMGTGASGPAYYFNPTETTRTTIDITKVATGANATVLVTGTKVSDNVVYGGEGGLGQGCLWQKHAAASLPGIVFIQVFRKGDIFGQQCND